MNIQNFVNVPTDSEVSSSKVLISTRIRYARNMKEYPFPSAMTKANAAAVWDKVSSVLSACEVFAGGHTLYIPDLKKNERIFFAERRMISPDMLKTELPSGVIVDKNEKFKVLVNEEDHLRISATGPRVISDGTLEKLDMLEKSFDEKLNFAYSKDYGYLTSCPTNLGSGLRISGLFHLVGLVLLKEIENFLDVIESKGFIVRGYYGERSKFYGDVFQISTGRISASDISMVLRTFEKIEFEELRARRSLPSHRNWRRFEDIIYRGWGVLLTARMISFAEAASIFSLILLAKHIGLDIPLDEKRIRRLITNCQPAHIQYIAGHELSSAARDEFRADYIRKFITESKEQGADDKC